MFRAVCVFLKAFILVIFGQIYCNLLGSGQTEKAWFVQRKKLYWHSISVVDLCKVHMNSRWENLLTPVTKAPEVTTRYPICSRALRMLKVGEKNSRRRFFSSLYSGRAAAFSDITRNSFKGRPSTVQLTESPFQLRIYIKSRYIHPSKTFFGWVQNPQRRPHGNREPQARLER